MLPLRLALLNAGLAALYFLAGKAGLEFFGLLHPSASAVWPPTGVAIAALLLYGYRVAPGVFVGAFVVNVTTAGTVLTSLGIACGNTLEGLAAAALVTRLAHGRAAFDHALDILKFAGLAALASTTLSATIGVGILTFAGLAEGAAPAEIWLTWWLGDAAGAMLATPLLLAWHANRSLRPASAGRLVEGALMFVTIAGMTSLLFFVPPLGRYPLAFLCLPPLVWAAFRFSTREVATAVMLMTVVTTWATTSGRGPFVMGTTNESLLVLQSFLAMIALTTLILAALVRERAGLLGRVSAERDDAQGALRSSDVFIAMLSHELRNPLAAIASAAAVLDNVGGATESAERARRIIKRQTEHVTRLLDDLLDVARITAGKIVLHLRRCDLAEAVESYVAALPDASAVTLELEHAWIDGDADRLDQIIGNLLHNARKFTAAGGRIRVRTFVDGDSAVLSIEDTGAGIVPDLLPRVFDLFMQGEQGLDRADGGLGVGLALVQRLVNLHGGSIEAASAGRGQGSTFRVTFPRADGDAPDAAATAELASSAHPRVNRRILVIEDNGDARESLRLLLASAGHEVHEAPDGETGVRLASLHSPDVALVDLGLPGIDGYEAARRIRAANPRIKLVALTGYGRADDRARSRSIGFDAHLVKPVDFARLAELL